MNEKNLDATISELPRATILALTRELVAQAVRRFANGQDVTQENIAIVNRARKALGDSK